MKKPQLLADILRLRVVVSGVTHVEVELDFRLFEDKGERPKKDVFEAYFIAAGTFMTNNCIVTVSLLSGIRLIVTNLSLYYVLGGQCLVTSTPVARDA